MPYTTEYKCAHKKRRYNPEAAVKKSGMTILNADHASNLHSNAETDKSWPRTTIPGDIEAQSVYKCNIDHGETPFTVK